MSARRVSVVGVAGSLRAMSASALLALTLANHATAQTSVGSSATDREQERTVLYREGVALAEAGRWADALAKFERVVAIRSAPRALMALGTAKEKAGKWIRAKHTYETTLADAKAAAEADL